MSTEAQLDMDRETEIIGNTDDSCDEADDSAETRENVVARQGDLSNGHQSAPLITSAQQAAHEKSQLVKKGRTLKLFVFNISLLMLLYISMLTYSNGVIRTLERRFGLRSAQTGLMQSANDIVHVCLVVFIGYFGRNGHKPRIICVTVLFMALAGFMMATPHFFLSSSAYDTVQYRLANTTATESGLLSRTSNRVCLSWNASGEAISGDQCDQVPSAMAKSSYVHPAYYVFLTAQFISGIGGSGLHTLSLAYIDENAPGSKSSVYIGIFTSMYAVGPMCGMMLAAITLRLPEYLLNPVEGSPSDASWIGCWWLGYAICSVGILVTALPLWFFPKSCSEKTTIAANKTVDAKLPGATTDVKTSSLARREILEFPRRLLHLLRNKAYVVNLLSVVCGGYVVFGVFVNVVRYIEIHFLERAFVGSIIAGVVLSVAGAIGGFFGGLLMSRLKLRPPGAVKVIIFSSSTFAAGLVVILFLQCPQLQVAGKNDPGKNTFTVETECNKHCACPTNRKAYDPVCGSDNLTYFSACSAGCRNFVNGTYSNCGCVGNGGGGGAGGMGLDGEEGGGGWARPGLCLPPCNLLIPYAATLFVMCLLGAIARVPSTIVNFRIVDDDERSFALSINSFTINLLAFVPAPLLFGSLIDSACILWQTTCKKTGGCLLFNTDRFRFVTYGVALAFEGIDFVLTILLFIFVRKMVFRDEDIDRKEIQTDTEEERRKESGQAIEMKS